MTTLACQSGHDAIADCGEVQVSYHASFASNVQEFTDIHLEYLKKDLHMILIYSCKLTKSCWLSHSVSWAVGNV